MNSNQETDHLLTKLNLDDETVVDAAISRLTAFLPHSVRMLATLQMHKAFTVPKLEVYQPRREDSKGENNIWFAVQRDDMTYTEVSLGLFCPDSPEEIGKVIISKLLNSTFFLTIYSVQIIHILDAWLDWTKEQSFLSNPDYISQAVRYAIIGPLTLYVEKYFQPYWRTWYVDPIVRRRARFQCTSPIMQ